MDYQLGPGPLQVDQNTTDEKIKGDIGIVENGDIATHAILKDYYVIWKGDLYKAKTDISSGTTLSAESNGNLDLKSNGIGGEVAALNGKLFYEISTTTDFNSLVNNGIYACPYYSNGSAVHRPVNSAGILMVHRVNGSAYTQTYTTYSNPVEVFTRIYVNDAWTEWKNNMPKYFTNTFSNVAITTRSSSGAYYATLDVTGIPSGKKIVSINTESWSGATANFSTNIAGSNTKVEFCSDVSQTVNAIRIGVLCM